MRVIAVKPVRDFAAKHGDAAPSLGNWLKITQKARGRTFAELRADFSSADQVERRTVFNIGGNQYRLIARVNYLTQRVFVLRIMKHTEYERGEWK